MAVTFIHPLRVRRSRADADPETEYVRFDRHRVIAVFSNGLPPTSIS
jgi:hypothetical protein